MFEPLEAETAAMMWAMLQTDTQTHLCPTLPCGYSRAAGFTWWWSQLDHPKTYDHILYGTFFLYSMPLSARWFSKNNFYTLQEEKRMGFGYNNTDLCAFHYFYLVLNNNIAEQYTQGCIFNLIEHSRENYPERSGFLRGLHSHRGSSHCYANEQLWGRPSVTVRWLW